jgi:hypothetical protein
MNRHVRDRQFLTFTRGLQGDRKHSALIDAIDAVAEATGCCEMHDGVCHLDKTNACACRDAAERVMGIAWDAEREGSFQP